MANKRKTGSRWWKVRVGMCREEVEGEEKEERTREPEDGGSEKVEKGNQSRNGKHKPRALEPGQRGKHRERAANNWLWENVGRVNKITQTFHIETEPELLNPWKRLRFLYFLMRTVVEKPGQRRDSNLIWERSSLWGRLSSMSTGGGTHTGTGHVLTCAAAESTLGPQCTLVNLDCPSWDGVGKGNFSRKPVIWRPCLCFLTWSKAF